MENSSGQIELIADVSFKSISLIGDGENGIMNVSSTPFGPDDSGTYGTSTKIPGSGYMGEVTISEKVSWKEPSMANYSKPYNGPYQATSRASIVYHELKENYERTSNKRPYYGSDGAHQRAIIAAVNGFKPGDVRYSLHPGVSTVN